MPRIVGVGIETIVAAIVLIPVLLIWKKRFSKNGKGYIYIVAFALYVSAVYAVVGLPTIKNYGFGLTIEWIPFIPMAGDLKNSVLNVILFIPLGILLPKLWDQFNSLKRVALFGFGTSLTIEILQVFTHRATDINDLILNTIGAVIGYVIVKNIIKKQQMKKPKRKIRHLYVLIGTVFIVMFFIQPFISEKVWEIIPQVNEFDNDQYELYQ